MDDFYLEARRSFKAGNIEEALAELDKAIAIRDDRSTELFRRFVTVWYTRHMTRDSGAEQFQLVLCERLSSENRSLLKDKATQQKELLRIKERIEALLNEQLAYKQKQKELQSDLEAVRERNGHLERQVETKKAALSAQERSALEYKMQAEKLYKQNEMLASEADDLKGQMRILRKQNELLTYQNERMQVEIRFLRKRSWLSNLLGIKPAEITRKQKLRR